MKPITREPEITLSWNYYSMHASQRMTVFGFFITLSTLLLGAIATCIKTGTALSIVGCILGIVLSLLSLVFAKLDQRTAMLIKIAEESIKSQEAGFENESARIFTADYAEFSRRRSSPFILSRRWSYRECFLVVFIFMGLAGISGSVICITTSLSQ